MTHMITIHLPLMPLRWSWLQAPVMQTHIQNSRYFAVPAGNNTSFSMKAVNLNGYTLFPLPWCHSQVFNTLYPQIKTSILRKPPCWMHHFAPVTLVLDISAWPLTFWEHEFLLSHLALAQTQSPPYVQPARCLGWKFSTEKAPPVYVVVIYLNSIFLFNCLPLTPGEFTLTPESWEGFCQCTRAWLDEAKADSCINHRCTEANRWYKIRQGPPMLWGRSGSIKSYLPCTTVQPPPPPPLCSSPSGSKQHRKDPSGICSTVIHFILFMKLRDVSPPPPHKLLWNIWLFQEKAYKHFKAGNFNSSRCHRVLLYVSCS